MGDRYSFTSGGPAEALERAPGDPRVPAGMGDGAPQLRRDRRPALRDELVVRLDAPPPADPALAARQGGPLLRPLLARGRAATTSRPSTRRCSRDPRAGWSASGRRATSPTSGRSRCCAGRRPTLACWSCSAIPWRATAPRSRGCSGWPRSGASACGCPRSATRPGAASTSSSFATCSSSSPASRCWCSSSSAACGTRWARWSAPGASSASSRPAEPPERLLRHRQAGRGHPRARARS